ncbi:AraC family transcriptional regulator [Deinococcus ruber]|uniref:AraC family transcriptional regulator n=1 Tax=Deinococcus ruber TaxID=1848197 RepID=A0A918CQN2_9DEIO|nr:AraC family transcriptional regulator [Deinococcus ruber]GGR33852.1 AraC family transcriptional regulator [Deinococcus ruber]
MIDTLETLPTAVMETLLDQVVDTMFFVKDTALRYVSVNEALLRRTGCRSKAQVLGRTAAELFAGPLGANITAQDAGVMKAGTGLSGQLETYLLPSGEPSWCLTSKQPLYAPDGTLNGLCGISRDLPVPNQSGPMYVRLAEALRLLQGHYGTPLRITTLAKVAGLSEDQFARTVQRLFGLTPKQLLIKTRLEAASELLLTSQLSVSEIAVHCGYVDHSAFTRQFRRVASMTPVQFRAAQQGILQPPTAA